MQCHGAHTIGKFIGDSNFAFTCAGCHGLEYLPELPSVFQKIVKTTDEIRDVWRDVEAKKIKPTEESLKLRRELRHTLAEWVHATDAEGAAKDARKFFEMSELLRKQLSASSK